MSTGSYNISLSFDQILDLVRQLPKKQKIKLSKELEKEAIESKLTRLLDTFKTDDLSESEITREVELIRSQLYEQSKKA